MNILMAQNTPGWMHDPELMWLAGQAATHKCIVEIGSWMGRSTRAMADNLTPGGVIYAVDTWTEDYAEVRDKPKEWLFNEFKRNTAGLSNIIPVQMKSVDAAKFLKSTKFDMVFIDANHEYEFVKDDILAWRPLLEEGGMFCGHDYGVAPGVTQAVNELVKNPTLACISIWRES